MELSPDSLVDVGLPVRDHQSTSFRYLKGTVLTGSRRSLRESNGVPVRFVPRSVPP
jgi:hypothetical protein